VRALYLLFAAAALAGAQTCVRVAERNPRYLELASAEAYIPIGPNIRKLAANGGTFTRVWISHSFYDAGPAGAPEGAGEELGRTAGLLLLCERHGAALWVCDAASDWRTELEQGRPAAMLSLTRDVRSRRATDAVEFCDSWMSRWTTGRLEKGRPRVPRFRRSLVVALEEEEASR